MNFSSKGSIFECTGSSIADFTLSGLEEGDSVPKLSVNSAHEETKQLNSKDKCSAQLADRPESNDDLDRSLTVLKVHHRARNESRHLYGTQFWLTMTRKEHHWKLSALRVFIQDLDAKYFEVARRVQERIEKLEECKSELSSEVERLRRFY
ncbi:hypothetical protein TcWFU_007411 [Taenia crassiceps]|uniref:Uncharacterized protein n=1 Tax=Taenia crassiceps TaxID=6207 RepID=A0ABR4QEM4_9CEST